MKMKTQMINHLKMYYGLATIINENMGVCETPIHIQQLHILCNCQSFGAIWKIYNKNYLTYSKEDSEEIELIRMYRWCEDYSNRNFGLTI